MERNMLRATDVVFWGSLGISLINIIAGLFGLPRALDWLFGADFPAILLVPCAIVIWGGLIFSWINSLMGNLSGMLILGANVLAAPFFYEWLGLPYAVGLIIAVFPYPVYFGGNCLIDRISAMVRR